MRYDFRKRGGNPQWAETADAAVVSCSDGLRWAIGKKIEVVMAWAAQHRLRVYVSHGASGPVTKMETKVWE